MVEENQKSWTIRGKVIRLIHQKMDEETSPDASKLSPAHAIQKIENALKQFPNCTTTIGKLAESLAKNGIPAFKKQVGEKFQDFLTENQISWEISGQTIRLHQQINEKRPFESITSQQVTCTLLPVKKKWHIFVGIVNVFLKSQLCYQS